MKIYLRIRTWIMFGIIVILPIIISLLVYGFSEDISMTNWTVMIMESYALFFFITIFTVVIASETVAGEFSWGTIKLLLIRPWSRSTILLSKYIAMILFALVLTITTFIVCYLVNLAFFGSGDTIDVILSNDESVWTYVLQYYLLKFVGLIMIVTFGFMMSAAFRSSGLAIALSISFLFAGNIITTIFALAEKAWVKYVLFIHLDLTPYLSSDGETSLIPGHPTTLGFSLGVLAAYFIIFNAISWIVFKKRDITA